MVVEKLRKVELSRKLRSSKVTTHHWVWDIVFVISLIGFFASVASAAIAFEDNRMKDGEHVLEAHSIQGYSFYIVESEHRQVSGLTTARIFHGSNRVFIEANRSRSSILQSCNHEMLHVKYPDVDHDNYSLKEDDPIYSRADDVLMPRCRVLIDRLDSSVFK